MLKIATKFAPHPENFSRASTAGFRYAEFWLSAELLGDVPEIVARAREYPLEYVPHFPNKKVDAQTVQQSAELYQQLHCRALVLHQPQQDRWGQELQSLCPGIELAVENHVLNEKEFWDWAERNPGLNLDVEHLWMFTLKNGPLAGVEKFLNRFLSRYSDKLKHVHLPGYLPGQPEHRPMYCSRDFVFLVWDLLAEFRYDYFVVSEVDHAFQTFEDLKMDLLLYNRWEAIQRDKRV